MARRGRSSTNKQPNLHFVTTTVKNFEKIFANDIYCDILINSLKFLLKRTNSRLIAYVIMPSHIHLILDISEGESLSDFMRDFKRFTSKKITETTKELNEKGILDKLTNNFGGFKIWMDRFDSSVITSISVLETKINYIHNNPVKAGLINEITDWKYSSARNYYADDNSVIEVIGNSLF